MLCFLFVANSQIDIPSISNAEIPNNRKRDRKRVRGQDKTAGLNPEDGPRDLARATLPTLPPVHGQRVFENASLEGIEKIFSQPLCSAIRRVTVQGQLKAAVTTTFPIWVRSGPVDCLMSLEIQKSSVEWFAMTLFNAKMSWMDQGLRVVLNGSVTLVIPVYELTLKGVSDKVILDIFGSEIRDAINESPMRKSELEDSTGLTECVSMILTKDGAIINLALGLHGGANLQNKLYT